MWDIRRPFVITAGARRKAGAVQYRCIFSMSDLFATNRMDWIGFCGADRWDDGSGNRDRKQQQRNEDESHRIE